MGMDPSPTEDSLQVPKGSISRFKSRSMLAPNESTVVHLSIASSAAPLVFSFDVLGHWNCETTAIFFSHSTYNRGYAEKIQKSSSSNSSNLDWISKK